MKWLKLEIQDKSINYEKVGTRYKLLGDLIISSRF
jgi:hypothetical protein